VKNWLCQFEVKRWNVKDEGAAAAEVDGGKWKDLQVCIDTGSTGDN
jgi:hypothetical protein